MARTTRRWRLAAVLAVAAILFSGAVSRDAHSHGPDHHAPVHHGVLDHAHSHDHGHSHSHDHEADGDRADANGDAAGRSGDVAGHAHFDVFSLVSAHDARVFEKSRLEPVPIAGLKRAWRSHFERPPKGYL